ncbi:MAG: hypothetical protein JSS39_01425 [Nitrospira sp.]|nr:hypothetical protein [Nitrospira sp.]
MHCYQCSNNAMYQVDERNIPLCLDCHFKFSQVQQQRLENNERMINYLSDEMSFTTGLPPMGPRFPPRPKSLVVAGTKLNNISVNNSVVGTINTGSLGTVDQSISALVQIGDPGLAEAIKGLSEAILQSGDLTRNQRNELVESLSVIAKEAASPKKVRQNSVALALIERASKITALADDIADVCQKWWPILQAAFSAATGG